MRPQKIFGFLFVLFIINSCKKEEQVTDYNPPVITQYSIVQSLPSFTEVEQVVFSLDNQNYFYSVKWFLNGNLVGNHETFTHRFLVAGTFTLEAQVTHANGTSVISKQVLVGHTPKYLVHIKKVEALSFPSFSTYTMSGSSNRFLKSYFNIIERDPFVVNVINFSYLIKYISEENMTNHNVPSFQTIVWDISADNYVVPVYKNGIYHPNGHGTYSTEFKFYGAKSHGSNPFNLVNTFKPSFNTYRDVRPETITFNNDGMQIRLTLEWEDFL